MRESKPRSTTLLRKIIALFSLITVIAIPGLMLCQPLVFFIALALIPTITGVMLANSIFIFLMAIVLGFVSLAHATPELAF